MSNTWVFFILYIVFIFVNFPFNFEVIFRWKLKYFLFEWGGTCERKQIRMLNGKVSMKLERTSGTAEQRTNIYFVLFASVMILASVTMQSNNCTFSSSSWSHTIHVRNNSVLNKLNQFLHLIISFCSYQSLILRNTPETCNHKSNWISILD